MNNPTRVAQAAVQTFLERGADSLAAEARRFVEETGLDKALAPSQVSRLQSAYQQHAPDPAVQNRDFAFQVREVRKFIDKQIDKDKKRGGKGWARVGNDVNKRIFEFMEEKSKVHTQVKELLRKKNSLPTDLENAFDDLFNPKLEQPEAKDLQAKDWQEKELERMLSRIMLVAIVTVYRCKREKLPIPEFEEE